MSDHIDKFRAAIEAAGISAPDEIYDDGRLHRFSTNGKRGDDSGWYVLHGDGIPAGKFGCWRAGFESTWCAKSDRDLSAAELQAMRDRNTAIQRQRDDGQARVHAEAKNAAALRLAQSEAVSNHPYLTAKGIEPHGVRVIDGKLLIPMRDSSGVLHSSQAISADGSKRYQSGGRVRGCYYAIGKPDGRLIICEGFATGASIYECTGHAVAVAFDAGNLGPVASELRWKYPALEITIAADDDHETTGNPGVTKARAAALAVGGKLAIPAFSADRPIKATDFNDLHQVVGADAVRQCIEAASFSADGEWPTPEPLSASYEALPYPLDALPQTIRDAVEEVIGFVKAPVPLAASSALSAVSVAVQGFYDIERAPGLKGPCSLYMLSIAESGERKTSCDGFFKQALEAWQREQTEMLKPAIANYEADKAAWEAKKSGILEAIKKAAKDNKPTAEHERALRDLEQEEPMPVRVPRLIRGDDTPENLGFSLMHEYPSVGALSSEAGVVFGGHAMGGESVTRNLALINVLWDGGSILIGRRTSESYTIENVRLSMGLQVQESTLRAFFDKSKGLARGTGFLARFLMAWPQSTMGTRLYSDAPDWSQLTTFNRRITQLLQIPLNIDDSGRLATKTLGLSADAHAVWVKFQNTIELQLAPDGELQDVKDVASKVADNAARLAGLFHVFENGVGAISADAMARGAKLAAWHLTEARRFLGQFSMPVEWMNADRLERWMIQHCRREGTRIISTRTAMQYGPLRDKSTMHAAVAHLEEHGRARMQSVANRRQIGINPALMQGTP